MSDELIRKLPKVELHCHFHGTVRPDTFIELAKKHGVELPTYDPDRVFPPFEDLEPFLEVVYLACALIRDPDDFSRVAYEYLTDAAASSNLRYIEMFFNPTNHPAKYPDMLDGLIDGIKAAKTDAGVRCRLIPSINREKSAGVARAVVEEVLADARDEVVGIGLDHNELAGPPERFAEAYELAARGGLRRTAHAGERGNVQEVVTTLDVLGVERIDHGYAIIKDPQLIQRALDTNLHFTGCWTLSSFYKGKESESAPYPIGAMRDRGLSVSVNTDDPTMFFTDLGEEYVRAATTLSWDLEQVIECNMQALDAAWLDDSERATMRAAFRRENDEVLAQRQPAR